MLSFDIEVKLLMLLFALCVDAKEKVEADNSSDYKIEKIRR